MLRKIKIVLLALCISITPAHAEVIENQTASDTYECTTTVSAEIGSQFTITVPKVIRFDKVTKESKYTVKVCGDVTGTQYISVVPDESFLMKSSGKDNVTATVSQEQTLFSSEEISVEDGASTVGIVQASDITAGHWSGNFYFNAEIKDSNDIEGLRTMTLNVSKNRFDTAIVPDKYNTGAVEPTGGFKTWDPETDESMTFDDLTITKRSDDLIIINGYSNSGTSGDVVIENVDFSAVPNFRTYNADRIGADSITFRNCKFSSVSYANVVSDDVPWLYFDHCSMTHYSGGKTNLDYCYIGGEAMDALNLFKDNTVTNCFITDKAHYVESGSVHTDGLQIYGVKDQDVDNITLDNCRFEIPQFYSGEDNKAYVNASLMLQLEYSSGANMTFKNCYTNGGSNSIYAHALGGWTLDNISFENIMCGDASGFIYSDIDENVEFKNVHITSQLYLGASWKTADGHTHVSITNDTTVDRTLRVYTDERSKTYIIPAMPSKEIMGSEGFDRDSVPFDVDYDLGTGEYFACFDTTNEYNWKQVRFITYGPESVQIKAKTVTCDVETGFVMLEQGNIGKDATYTLYSNGQCIVEGTGSLNRYTSGAKSPLSALPRELNTYLKELIVKEGITGMGAQIATYVTQLEVVRLPEGITEFTGNQLANSRIIDQLYLPASLVNIGDRCISHVAGKSYYAGSESQWSGVTVGNYNDNLNPTYDTGTKVISYYNQDKSRLFKCEIVKSSDVPDDSFFKSKIDSTHEWQNGDGAVITAIPDGGDLDLFLVEKKG